VTKACDSTGPGKNCTLSARNLFAMSSMITTAAWVPRGYATPFPQKYDFDEDEFERIAGLAKLQLDDANEDLEEAQKKNGKDDSDNEDDSADEAETDVPVEKAEAKPRSGTGGASLKQDAMDDE